jgi:hypothetical protein
MFTYDSEMEAYGYCFNNRPVYVRKHLDPLFSVLKEYDALRMQLMEKGGRLTDMENLSNILQREIIIRDASVAELSLINQKALKRTLGYFDDGDLVMDIRQQECGLPLYYICKVQSDYNSTYNSVVEDLYISPGYTFTDCRLVKLMDWGHQYIFLRLSPYREKLISVCKNEPKSDDIDFDKELSRLGSQVLQYAWNEDQNIGIHCSEKFGLPNFRRAVELVYLCLTADLCDLRSNTDRIFLKFFEQVYQQPAIQGFLEGIQNANDLPIMSLQQKARISYTNLLRIFNKLLTCKVVWGGAGQTIPLYKLVFANMFRLDLVWQEIENNQSVRDAAGQLEVTALNCIQEINNI